MDSGLDGIGTLRNALKTAHNRLRALQRGSETSTKISKDALKRHLDLDSLSAEAVVNVVNQRRKLLALPELTGLTADSRLDRDLQAGATVVTLNKVTAIRDAQAAVALASREAEAVAEGGVLPIVTDLLALETDPSLLSLLDQRDLVEQGLRLVTGETCPLCDFKWDSEEDLRAHLSQKMAKTKAAEEVRGRVAKNATAMQQRALALSGTLDTIVPLAKLADPSVEPALTSWSNDLKEFSGRLGGPIRAVLAERMRLETDWTNAPGEISTTLNRLLASVQAQPDQSAVIAAQSFLTVAQERFSAYRQARHREMDARRATRLAEDTYTTYCDVSEQVLNSMYEAVEERFSEFYQFINADDESSFKAEFAHDEGKLDLAVDFYGKGMFPPAAYHSEGHQDGMGVCLYLALMERLLGSEFRFAVLDDVVMSVDTGHRRQFCRLLRKYFSGTQFIITTHDGIWARQMRSEGVVTGAKSLIQFHGWSVQSGPIYEADAGVWATVATELERDDIASAAAHLRRYLEYAASDLADSLRAEIAYKGDASYDLGDLLPAVIRCHGQLLSKAAKAAESWKDDEAKQHVASLKQRRADTLGRFGGEQWILNKAVHFNEWAELSRADFEPIVAAARGVIELLSCPICSGWLQVVPPRGPEPQSLRCPCSKVSVNLTSNS